MRPLHLSGYGVKISVQNMRSRSDLHIRNGREGFERKNECYSFRPRQMPYDSIIIDGHSGYVSLQAFHWLSRNKVPVFVLNFDGSLINSILPPISLKADLRVAQIHASEDPDKRFRIAHELVKAKIQRSLDVLHWLRERYDLGEKTRKTEREALALSKATSVNDLRMVEGRVAQYYWETFQSVLPECFDFKGRLIRSGRANDASDPVNLALNYGYGMLEGECRRAINTVGLEPSIGFLHESSGSQTKQSLVYDLQEPYRWLIDVSVIKAFELSVLDLPDFYFTGDDYRYHIEVEAKRRFMNLLQEQFNAGVRCNGKTLKWDTIIEQKANQLGRFFVGQASIPEFDEPSPGLQKDDKMRSKILALISPKVKQRRIEQSTLRYLRQKTRSAEELGVYLSIHRRLK